jgi:hypothetical protein
MAAGARVPAGVTASIGMEHGPAVSAATYLGLSRPLRDAKTVAGLASGTARAGSASVNLSRRVARRDDDSAPGAPTENFDGIACVTPPSGVCGGNVANPSGAIGPTDYVEAVNSGIAVFGKDGSVIMPAKPLGSLFTGVPTSDGNACASANWGGGEVVYDIAADRFVVAQTDISEYENGTGNTSFECVAVSQTGDPTGAYYAYEFSYNHSVDADAALGVWTNGYYATFDMFNGRTFAGADLCVYDRAAMLQGQTATQQCFQQDNYTYGIIPATIESTTAPPPGADEYLISYSGSWSDLLTWRFHVDWNTPANTTISRPSAYSVVGFTPACYQSTTFSCVGQPSPGNPLHAESERLNLQAVYENFSDHASLLVAQTVDTTSASGIAWYELRSGETDTTMNVYQQGLDSSATDQNWRWTPSIAMDKLGDIAEGYSETGPSLDPSLAYAGVPYTSALDSTGTETIGYTGAGVETGTLADGKRAEAWGPNSSLMVDPSNGCTFWDLDEYYQSNGTSTWGTRILAFGFPFCGKKTVTVTIKDSQAYGTTPNLSSIPANDSRITYSPSGQAADITGTLSCTTPATATSHASSTPYQIAGCSGLSDSNGYYVLYNYLGSGYMVTKVNPTLSWTTPAAITYGAALGSKQLDATASIAGKFTYTPSSGTVLNAGQNQTLSAKFKPSDTTDYNGSTVTRTITVNAAPLSIIGKDATVAYRAHLSKLGFKAKGFVNEDGTGSLSKQPTCTSTVKVNGSGDVVSPPGKYPITCTGAKDSDYHITYQAGTLTVVPAPTTITYTGPTSAGAGATVNLSATLRWSSGVVAHRKLVFKLGSATCSGKTSKKGIAKCSVRAPSASGKTHVKVKFAGDPAGKNDYFAASHVKKAFQVG